MGKESVCDFKQNFKNKQSVLCFVRLCLLSVKTVVFPDKWVNVMSARQFMERIFCFDRTKNETRIMHTIYDGAMHPGGKSDLRH